MTISVVLIEISSLFVFHTQERFTGFIGHYVQAHHRSLGASKNQAVIINKSLRDKLSDNKNLFWLSAEQEQWATLL